MEKKILTKKDFDSDNVYKYADSLVFDGHIEIDGGLGYVKFKDGLSAKGFIYTKAGSGIEAGWGIEAGEGIKAGWGIEAGSGIEAGWGIEAGSGIEAGEGIKAGSGIEAGWGIKAGEGIISGLLGTFGDIVAKWIDVKLRIAAGFNVKEECKIKAEIRNGIVILGKQTKKCSGDES